MNQDQYIRILNTEFSSRIKELRQKAGWTKAELAANSKLTPKTIHDLEMGRKDKVQEKTLLLLAGALGLSSSELLENLDKSPDDGTPKGRLRVRALRWIAFIGILVALIAFGASTLNKSSATWEVDDYRLIVRGGIFGNELWKTNPENEVHDCAISPWSSSVLLVAAKGTDTEGGAFLALSKPTGKVLWSVKPDKGLLLKSFSSVDLLEGKMRCHFFIETDLDGDGVKEIAVKFYHSKWYPSTICLVDSDGTVLAQYDSAGHLGKMLAADVDQDGCDELLITGVSNSPGERGALILMLDKDHFSGAFSRSDCEGCSAADSSLFRVILPNYPPPYQALSMSLDIVAYEVNAFQQENRHQMITVNVGTQKRGHFVVVFNNDLTIQRVKVTSGFQARALAEWPDSLIHGYGPLDPEWRKDWIDSSIRFESGKLVEK